MWPWKGVNQFTLSMPWSLPWNSSHLFSIFLKIVSETWDSWLRDLIMWTIVSSFLRSCKISGTSNSLMVLLLPCLIRDVSISVTQPVIGQLLKSFSSYWLILTFCSCRTLLNYIVNLINVYSYLFLQKLFPQIIILTKQRGVSM